MKPDPELPIKFANAVLEQLAFIRTELITQRKLLIALSSHNTHERRRDIKGRLRDQRRNAHDIAAELKREVGLIPDDEQL